jgi:hypothetical protein
MDSFVVYSRGYIARAELSFVMEQILALMALDTGHCKIEYLSYLICRVRELMCPHTKDRSFCPEWDKLFSYVLVHSVSQCVLHQAWGRKIKEIVTFDLELTDPHDGSAGHVVHLFQAMKNVLDAVVSNDKKTTMLILQRSKLRLPVLNITDQFGWNLLHHASFHSATDVMKALVFEGISPNDVCHQGQTPIHIAAAALRYGSITTFLGLGTLNSPLSLTIKDSHGHSPLQCLLHSLSVGSWSRKLSSQQLLDFILMLLGPPTSLWNFDSEDGGTASREHWTAFSAIVIYSDAYVAENIIKHAFDALFLKPDETQDCTMLEMHKQDVIHEVKIIILTIIRKKKSRVLARLLTTFGEILFEDSTLTSSSEDDNTAAESLAKSPVSSFCSTVIPHRSSIYFLHQCLYAAAETNSLRVMSMLLKFCAII